MPTKVKFVEYGEQAKVKIVSYGEDMQVTPVEYGEQMKVKIVEYGEDFKVKIVQGGCLVATACIEAKGLPDNCPELTTARAFRESYIRALPNGEEIVREYYEVAPRIIAGINKADDPQVVYSSLYKEIVSVVELINSGENGKALSSYSRILSDLKQKYGGGDPF